MHSSSSLSSLLPTLLLLIISSSLIPKSQATVEQRLSRCRDDENGWTAVTDKCSYRYQNKWLTAVNWDLSPFVWDYNESTGKITESCGEYDICGFNDGVGYRIYIMCMVSFFLFWERGGGGVGVGGGGCKEIYNMIGIGDSISDQKNRTY